MNIFYDEHTLILQALIQTKVDFMLVGGYAVIYYGYNRVTGDMDIWLNPTNENKELLVKALGEIGFDEAGLSVISGWDFTKPQIFHIGNEPERTDFMTFISGVKYGTAKENAIQANIEGLYLHIIHLNNLIENKKVSGRHKDLADAEHLEKIMHLKNNKP